MVIFVIIIQTHHKVSWDWTADYATTFVMMNGRRPSMRSVLENFCAFNASTPQRLSLQMRRYAFTTDTVRLDVARHRGMLLSHSFPAMIGSVYSARDY